MVIPLKFNKVFSTRLTWYSPGPLSSALRAFPSTWCPIQRRLTLVGFLFLLKFSTSSVSFIFGFFVLLILYCPVTVVHFWLNCCFIAIHVYIRRGFCYFPPYLVTAVLAANNPPSPPQDEWLSLPSASFSNPLELEHPQTVDVPVV